ncbi:hypothetical protein K469DRAFT_790845 [Zopfia rhizophila CBS 207.26]|uniref:Uncharacterized protein n=1 Tax=Zopfia rhizophila CBS 207.26 TaxID=1314779 RepID=A0A6A6DUH6_9PEZI|nr:hypothetical protein K469DRAFT_790845 [Zopfia rhizophila CBS 207.26]
MQLWFNGFRDLTKANVENGVSTLPKWATSCPNNASFKISEMRIGAQWAHFAILKCLLLDGGGCIYVDCDTQKESSSVLISRRLPLMADRHWAACC